MGNVSQTIEDIAHDLYTIGLFRELGLSGIQQQVRAWINSKVKAVEKK